MPEREVFVRLHGYYRSSASFRVRIALNLKGVSYEQIPHHLRKDEHRSPEYLAFNPQGFVPVLETDGAVLIQSLAIIEYLEERFPNPPLLPADPLGRARVRALAEIVACDIHPLNNLRVLRYLRNELGHDQPTVERWYNHWIAEGFQALETMLASQPETGTFCHGHAPSLADVCLIPQVVNAQNFQLDMAPFPTIQRIFTEALRLPAFARALPANQPDAE
jgi:maleylacetoacetate isomerase